VTKTTIRRPLSRHRRHERSGYEGGVQLHDVAFSSLLTNSISLANTKPTEFVLLFVLLLLLTLWC